MILFWRQGCHEFRQICPLHRKVSEEGKEFCKELWDKVVDLFNRTVDEERQLEEAGRKFP